MSAALLPPIHPDDCEECVQACEAEECAIELTAQCTDQCVVVPCDDAHHAAAATPIEPLCDAVCTEENCTTLDELFQCCFNYHQQQYQHYPPRPSSDPTIPHTVPYTWDNSIDELIASAHQPSSYQQTAQNMYYPDPSQLLPSSQSTSSFASTPELEPRSPHTGIGHHSHDHATPISPALSAADQNAITPLPTLKCMWGDCSATFTSMSDLVGHVNLQHLRLPSTAVLPQPQNPQRFDAEPAPQSHHQPAPQVVPDALSCLWADCQLYPTPNSVPGPSNGNHSDSALGVLASHLLQDHLGLPTAKPTLLPVHQHTQPAPEHQRNTQFQRPSSVPRSSNSSSSALPIAGPPTPSPEHDCSAPNAHVCRWAGCGQAFASCDALTTHINETHVGGGKAHYDCFWDACARNGPNGFASKQKICRHLQSHTGHRPFQCKVCQQNFSEAATLAQHMRRHTQEKPYVCDFPGCGKSFAITGALTIHKRTHNGHKPFKCTYCERAFAESSNLSKHLRTHTGARPYPCTHPDCNKSFARPDQLARHMAVHKKKVAITGGGGVEPNGATSFTASMNGNHGSTFQSDGVGIALV